MEFIPDIFLLNENKESTKWLEFLPEHMYWT